LSADVRVKHRDLPWAWLEKSFIISGNKDRNIKTRKEEESEGERERERVGVKRRKI
jgi:hypothetical protein